MIETSPAYDVLQGFILPEDPLQQAEEQFPGLIRVRVTTRNRARLIVEGETWNFFLDESQVDEAKFQLEETLYNKKDNIEPLFWDLVWHHAAEAILAVRQGHREARRNAQLRRRQKEEHERMSSPAWQDRGFLTREKKDLTESDLRKIAEEAFAAANGGYVELTINGITVHIGGGDDAADVVRKFKEAGGKLA